MTTYRYENRRPKGQTKKLVKTGLSIVEAACLMNLDPIDIEWAIGEAGKCETEHETVTEE